PHDRCADPSGSTPSQQQNITNHHVNQSFGPLNDLHSFPTRRSSDLKSVHGVLNPTYQAGLRRDAVQPDIEAERKKRDEIERRRRSEERFSRNAETDLVCRLLLEKKNARREWI